MILNSKRFLAFGFVALVVTFVGFLFLFRSSSSPSPPLLSTIESGPQRARDSSSSETALPTAEAKQKSSANPFASASASPFHTVLSRASSDKSSPHCYYHVRNFCIHPSNSNDDNNNNIHDGGSHHRGDYYYLQLYNPIAASFIGTEFSTKKLRLCNELRKKFNLPFVVQDSGEKEKEKGDDKEGGRMKNNGNKKKKQHSGTNSSLAPDLKNIQGRAAHIIACWQFYGYHLFQCSVAAFYAELQQQQQQRQRQEPFFTANASFGFSTSNRRHQFDLWLYNHAVTLPKISRDHYSHKMFLGSDDSWLDSSFLSRSQSHRKNHADSKPQANKKLRNDDHRAVLDAPLWGLWAVNALGGVHQLADASISPGRVVRELRIQQLASSAAMTRAASNSTPSFCYKSGIIGQPVHHVVPTDVRMEHVKRLKKMFLPSTAEHENEQETNKTVRKKFQILVSQREHGSKQGSRKIANLNQLLQRLLSKSSSNLISAKFDVVVVDFATKRFDEQMKLAHDSHIMISTHGAGNIWLAFLSSKPSNSTKATNATKNTTTSANSPSQSSPLFIELWPQDTVARDVYQVMCRQYGVRYVPLFARMKPLFSKPEEVKFSFLHQDVEAPLKELQEVLEKEC